MILLSRTYQMASMDNEADRAIDPNNEGLWRYERRRLDAEAIRDSLLAVSGALDRSPAGPQPFPPVNTWKFTQHDPFQAVYETNHRSVYLMTQRTRRHPFLALFDGADPNASTAQRNTTTVPTQALYFLNDPFVHAQADRFAARLLQGAADDAGRIDLAHRLAYGRPATLEETRAANCTCANTNRGRRTPGRRRRSRPRRRGRATAACCSRQTNSSTSIDSLATEITENTEGRKQDRFAASF